MNLLYIYDLLSRFKHKINKICNNIISKYILIFKKDLRFLYILISTKWATKIKKNIKNNSLTNI
jgi:hypothetical protein